MAFDYKILWTEEAINNLEEILDYLNSSWTYREIAVFKKNLSKQISHIKQNTGLFPVSEMNPGLRKSVLRKQTTICYEVYDSVIFPVYLFCNVQNIKKIE